MTVDKKKEHPRGPNTINIERPTQAPSMSACLDQAHSTLGNTEWIDSIATNSGPGAAMAAEWALSVAGIEASGAITGSNQAMLRMMRQASERQAPANMTGFVERSTGAPLPRAVRTKMEHAFGHDFAGVRVHTNAQAEQAAQAISAHAFTTGRDIYFNRGQYAPSSPDGEKLLIHELTHVVQHDEGRLSGQSGVSQPTDPTEKEAYANEARIAALLPASAPPTEAPHTGETSTAKSTPAPAMRRIQGDQVGEDAVRHFPDSDFGIEIENAIEAFIDATVQHTQPWEEKRQTAGDYRDMNTEPLGTTALDFQRKINALTDENGTLPVAEQDIIKQRVFEKTCRKLLQTHSPQYIEEILVFSKPETIAGKIHAKRDLVWYAALLGLNLVPIPQHKYTIETRGIEVSTPTPSPIDVGTEIKQAIITYTHPLGFQWQQTIILTLVTGARNLGPRSPGVDFEIIGSGIASPTLYRTPEFFNKGIIIGGEGSISGGGARAGIGSRMILTDGEEDLTFDTGGLSTAIGDSSRSASAGFNVKGGRYTRSGTGAAEQAPTLRRPTAPKRSDRAAIAGVVHFYTDEDVLLPAAEATLGEIFDEIFARAVSHEELPYQIRLIGSASNTTNAATDAGADQINESVAQDRIVAVKAYLNALASGSQVHLPPEIFAVDDLFRDNAVIYHRPDKPREDNDPDDRYVMVVVTYLVED